MYAHSNLQVNVPPHLASKMQMLRILCSYGVHVCMYSTCGCMWLVIEHIVYNWGM